jgi:hypothetical protein
MSSRNRSADKISDRFLPSPERTTLWPIASDDSDGDDIQTAETGEVHAKHDYHDDPETARWRYRLVMATAAIALAGLGVVSAFAYRAVSAGAALLALPPIVKELIQAVGVLKTSAPLLTRVGIATGLVVVGDLVGSGEAPRYRRRDSECRGTSAGGCRAGTPSLSFTRQLVRVEAARV